MYFLQTLDYSSVVHARSSAILGCKIWVDKEPIMFSYSTPSVFLGFGTYVSFIFFSFFCLSFSFLCPFLFSVFTPNVQQAPPILGQVWLVFCGYNDGNVSYQTGGYCLKIPEGMIYIYLLLCLLLVVFNNIYTYRMLNKYLCIRKVKLIK